MEDLLFELINNILEKNVFLVYGIFFLSAFLQMVFPPHPGDVLIVFQGYLTTTSEHFNVAAILMNSMIATFIGSVCVFEAGYRKGEKVFEYKLINRFISVKHRKKTRRLFKRYGSYAILASKFVLGLNAVIILFAGIFRVKRKIGYATIVVSIIVHHIIFLLLGRIVGNNIGYVKRIISTYNGIAFLLLVTFVTVIIVYRLRKRKEARGTNKEKGK